MLMMMGWNLKDVMTMVEMMMEMWMMECMMMELKMMDDSKMGWR